MDPLRYDAVAVGITREGRWLRYTGDLERLPANSWLSDEAACTPCTLLLDRGERTLMDLDGSGRRIRLDGAADSELLRRSRPRLRFAKKVSAALMEEAVVSLAQAKSMHDDLEAIYNPHVDFEGVYAQADAVIEELLSLRG